MSRSQVTLRRAEADDAPLLAELWATVLRRAEHEEHIADVEGIIAAADRSSEVRIVVAEYDGVLAGAVHLTLTTVSPLNLDRMVAARSPIVFDAYRRHGIGRLLMESAVSFAEENGVSTVGTAAASSSREANRFMARLAFAPSAVLRLAPTVSVRARLEAQRPTLAVSPAGNGRQLTRVLAARRSMRRSQTAN